MGYELNLYLIEYGKVKLRKEKYINPHYKNARFGNIIAHVNLVKTGQDNIYHLHKRTSADAADGKGELVFIFATNPDEEDFEDLYGDTLSVMDPEEVLQTLKKDFENSKKEAPKGYRRCQITIALLENAIQTFGSNLRVVGFGH